MRINETKLLQGPPTPLPAPTARVRVPWMAFAALGMVVYSTRLLFYPADAACLDAVAVILCATWFVMRQGWLGWVDRLLIVGNLVMVPLTVAYVALGVEPLGVLQALYLLLTSRPPLVMMMGMCL